jgi:hypothetical protein
LFADLYLNDNGATVSAVPQLTSLECPELVTVGGAIDLQGMLELGLISFPVLKGAGETFVGVGYGGANLSFPALVNAAVLQVTGRVARYGGGVEIIGTGVWGGKLLPRCC